LLIATSKTILQAKSFSFTVSLASLEGALSEKTAVIEELKKRISDLEIVYQERLKIKE